MKKKIAFFDFDGTVTTKDTLLEFIRFSKGSFLFYLGFLLNLHYLIGYKLKIITNQAAKEKILAFFFANMPLEKFQEYCAAFTQQDLPRLIRPKAVEEIRRLQQEGLVVVIVSASPENWIRAWAESMKLELLASQLELKEGKLTGRILGKNCHGDEKVRRITGVYDLSQYEVMAAYGDSSGDWPMLRLAGSSHYKPFRN